MCLAQSLLFVVFTSLKSSWIREAGEEKCENRLLVISFISFVFESMASLIHSGTLWTFVLFGNLFIAPGMFLNTCFLLFNVSFKILS